MNPCEIRDPIHGFISIDAWERDIVNHPIFQRLRRIKQLALTDMVYPGAHHSRFEHSLGVMHLASRMYDNIVMKKARFLHDELGYDESGIKRIRRLLRLTALLHDIGHAPYSHPAEEIMPLKMDGARYTHEEYSEGIINFILKDVIEEHPDNRNYKIKSEEISNLLIGKSSDLSKDTPWRDLISSQLDADRADYLLRDSFYTGTKYGLYDLERILVTISVNYSKMKNGYTLGFELGGNHAAEALIIARFMMFTQVYFHKTRCAYDIHIKKAMQEVYKNVTGYDCFPTPVTKSNLEEYLKWDDWKVNGLMKDDKGGEHAKRIIERDHYRKIHETPEITTKEDIQKIEARKQVLENEGIPSEIISAQKSWYKPDVEGILIFDKKTENENLLSDLSPIAKALCEKTGSIRLYVSREDKERAEELIKGV